MKISNAKAVLFLPVVFFLTTSAYASDGLAKAPHSTGKSTHMTVDSSELEPFSLIEKPEPDERIQFYKDGDVVGGFNENGEPNIGTKF